MGNNIKKRNLNLLGYFLLWPGWLFFSSIINFRANWAKNAMWLFIVFFGFTFIAREGNDSSRYIIWFEEIHDSRIGFLEFFKLLYASDTNYVDVFQPLLTFFVAKLTGDSRILFAVFGFVFGFFYTRNIWFLIEKTDKKYNVYALIPIISFSLIVPFWAINGIRFWTATMVFFYGIIRFLTDEKKNGFWIAALSFLVHFSFFFPVLVFLLYRLLGSKTKVFLVFFLSTSFVSEINVPVLRNFLTANTPAVFHNRIEGYTQDEKVARFQEGGPSDINWYAVWYRKALNIAFNVLLILIFFKEKEVWVKRRSLLRLFSFLLLFGGFANLGSLIPSVSRFITVSNLFSAAFLFFVFSEIRAKTITRQVYNILLPAFALFLVVAIRTGFDNTSILAFIANPIIAPFINNEFALIDLIKN